MVEFWRGLFSANFMPHGMCYLWDPAVLWLNVISDALIALSYYAIPFLLLALVRRRRDLRFRGIYVAFALFILACGTTHLLGVVVVWHPVYRLDGVVKAITAAASVATAAMVVPLLPLLVALPSPSQLAETNLALAKEIEERKSAEEKVLQVNAELEQRVAARTAELQTSMERYRFLADAMPQVVFTAVPDGTIRYFNQRWYTYRGVSGSSLEWQGAIHPGDLPGLLEKWEGSMRTGNVFEMETRIQSAKGDYRWHLVRAVPMRGSSDEITQWVATATDIDDAKRVQEQLLQAQKMEAVGKLAGGVAHDFNNLLTVISGFNEMLAEGLEGRPALASYAKEIGNAATRASELTSQLLAFSRRQMAQPRMLDLNEIVARAEKMLRRLIGEDIELAISLAPDLGLIEADPGQIDQILLNLAVNARDAMPGGGKLTIETANVELDRSYTNQHPGVEPGQYVQLAVTDTGVGLDTETRGRIFEPFFTTKTQGSGTGLGLSIVYGIIKQNGGDILVYSEPGKGASFKIYLPRKQAPTERPGKAKLPQTKATGSETILVVEDEAGVLKLVANVLREHGYTVLATLSPQEAIRIVENYRGTIDLLLTDVVMPQMSGPDLAKALTARRPDLKAVYMSGYAETGIVRHGLLDAGVEFIQKPFTAAALTSKIRAALGPS